MPLSFIHTADWQIGRPFGAFDERKRTLLREARLTVIDRIADAAASAGADFVLVAGDVFDSPTVADQLLRQTLARLAKHGGLTWHLLPGNHDPLRPGGVWERIGRIGVPGNVVVHARPEPYPLGSGAVLLPAPLTAAASGSDPTAWMEADESPPGMVRIGLAHGSIRGFGSEGQAAQQIAPSRAHSANLTYLALGDWHGAKSISERTWYSGTPEPDRYPDNEPGYVLSVRIGESSAAGPAPVRVARLATAQFAWSERHVVLEQFDDWKRLAADLARNGARAGFPADRFPADRFPADRHLLKLVVRGVVTLAERARVEAGLAALEPALFHLDADLSGLHDRPADDDLEALHDDGIRSIAARLMAMVAESAAQSDAPGASLDGDVARHALRKLLRLDAQLAAAPLTPSQRQRPEGI